MGIVNDEKPKQNNLTLKYVKIQHKVVLCIAFTCYFHLVLLNVYSISISIKMVLKLMSNYTQYKQSKSKITENVGIMKLTDFQTLALLLS